MNRYHNRAINEINHGEYLANGKAEEIWGWGSPAGKVRAERRAILIAQGANLTPGLNVLELGCGTGNFTEKFARFGSTILACDISQSLVEKALSRNLPAGQIRFICSRFEDCGFGGTFDAIIGSSILHHLEIESALKKIYNLLKPNGTICFAEPNMLNPQIFTMLTFRRYFPHFSPDETAFIRFMFKWVLEKVGFINVKIIPFDWLHPLVPAASIPIVTQIGTILEKLPLVREFSGSLLIKATK